MTWIRGGAIASLALAMAFALLRRWKTARVLASIGTACALEWREARMARQVGVLLAKAGSKV